MAVQLSKLISLTNVILFGSGVIAKQFLADPSANYSPTLEAPKANILPKRSQGADSSTQLQSSKNLVRIKSLDSPMKFKQCMDDEEHQCFAPSLRIDLRMIKVFDEGTRCLVAVQVPYFAGHAVDEQCTSNPLPSMPFARRLCYPTHILCNSREETSI